MNTHLIIAPISERGEIMALYPHEYTDLGRCTIEDFKKTTEQSLDAQRIALNMKSLSNENEIRLKLIFDALTYAGIITPQGIDVTPFLRPYFEKFIIEHEAKQTFWAKWKMKQKHRQEVFWANIRATGMGFVSTHGTTFVLWLKKKFGK